MDIDWDWKGFLFANVLFDTHRPGHLSQNCEFWKLVIWELRNRSSKAGCYWLVSKTDDDNFLRQDAQEIFSLKVWAVMALWKHVSFATVLAAKLLVSSLSFTSLEHVSHKEIYMSAQVYTFFKVMVSWTARSRWLPGRIVLVENSWRFIVISTLAAPAPYVAKVFIDMVVVDELHMTREGRDEGRDMESTYL